MITYACRVQKGEELVGKEGMIEVPHSRVGLGRSVFINFIPR